uniref:DUF2235 domain-containing protein n=1 Tax=Bradyrhizobium barranii subsp. barranii TaxID=2823807 RepID=A0A939MNH9_9BRAD
MVRTEGVGNGRLHHTLITQSVIHIGIWRTLGEWRAMPKNILIFSDGKGQAGGINFDEARTNVYKLYRACRVGPDTKIEPSEQVAFYDPGLGSASDGGHFKIGWMRWLYNLASMATGLGITRNIVDCYAAIIGFTRKVIVSSCSASAEARIRSDRSRASSPNAASRGICRMVPRFAAIRRASMNSPSTPSRTCISSARPIAGRMPMATGSF